jgi:hypothetical protein
MHFIQLSIVSQWQLWVESKHSAERRQRHRSVIYVIVNRPHFAIHVGTAHTRTGGRVCQTPSILQIAR